VQESNLDNILFYKRRKLHQLVEEKGNFLDLEVQQLSREIDQLILILMTREAKLPAKG